MDMESAAEGIGKKRKTSTTSTCYGADDEDEEKKIDKFFALIRSIREARDRIISNGSKLIIERSDDDQEDIISERKKKVVEDGDDEKKKKHPPRGVAVWNPSFCPEDFAEDAASAKLLQRYYPVSFEPSPLNKVVVIDHKHEQEEEGQETKKGCLDLNLSL